jgi:DNA-directed RNA polymerase subunit beta'
VLGANVDLSGMGVIIPNPSLKLNEVGLPEEYAWKTFGPFVIRRMIEKGRDATYASKALTDRTEDARRVLHEVMKERPVLVNRAPTLHKYGIMALQARPVSGHAVPT